MRYRWDQSGGQCQQIHVHLEEINSDQQGNQPEESWNCAQYFAADEDLMTEPPAAAHINKEGVRATVWKLRKCWPIMTRRLREVKAWLRYISKNFPAKQKRG